MATSRLKNIATYGQSVWIDNLSRPMLNQGVLKKLIDEDGISGVTSNPAIFEKSMAKSEAYDNQMIPLAKEKITTESLYEQLAIEDIRAACDELKAVYDNTNGTDGFVSFEVSPHLANETEQTIKDAERLWTAVRRPNLLIKIPATPAGISAIQATLEKGINVNITLLFSLDAYRDTMNAYLSAMERRLQNKEPLDNVFSVASFFLSRIDTKIDKRLDKIGSDEAKELRGKAAIANAKLAYQLWKEMFSGPRWDALKDAGCRAQKPLWASTSTKDPSYPDVLYVEPLIGPETINTMPDQTVDAFRDHGTAANTVENDLELNRKYMDRLAKLGIDLKTVTDELLDEGIEKFATPFDALIDSLSQKRKKLISQ